MSASSDVCKFAVDTVVVTTPKTKVKLRDLMHNVATIQDATIKLEIDIIRHLNESKDFHLSHIDSKAVMGQTENIRWLMRRCEGPLREVTKAVEVKAEADQSFFNKASMGIGALCASKDYFMFYHPPPCFTNTRSVFEIYMGVFLFVSK